MNVKVLRRHIEAGSPRTPGQGPIELALKDAGVFNPKIERVNGKEIAARSGDDAYNSDVVWIISWDRPDGKSRGLVLVNGTVVDFMLQFDAGESVDEEEFDFSRNHSFFSATKPDTINVGPTSDTRGSYEPKAILADKRDWENTPERWNEDWSESSWLTTATAAKAVTGCWG